MDEDDDYEYANEDDVFVPEVNVRDRVGRGGLATYSLKGAKNPLEKFKIILGSFLEETSSVLKLSDYDRATIFTFALNSPDIIYKNAACFVLGYIASGVGKNEDIKDINFKKACDGIEKIQTTSGEFEGIESADILRYAVYWKNNYTTT